MRSRPALLPILLLPALLLLPLTSQADYAIKAPRPGSGDFRTALRVSRAVDRQVPMRVTAGPKARAQVQVRDGAVHEHAAVLANVDFDTFLRRLDPARWSINLPQRWGGAVVALRDTRSPARGGRGVVLQQERMVLGLPALDMTKNSIVTVGKDRARVAWQVTHSDRSLPALGHRTVQLDNGWIEFARTADNKVRISSRSAHRVSTLPSLPIEKLAPGLAGRLAAASLKRFFESTLQRYQEIGEGRRPMK